MEKRPALGKGLSALIPDAPDVLRTAPIEADIDRLAPNDFQPRLDVNDARLQELAQSIKSNGVIQPIVVRREVASGRWSMGHARALLSLTSEAEQRQTARDVIARGLSVRETESLVKKITEGGAPGLEATGPKPVDVHTRAAEDRLKLVLGTRGRIVRQGARGRIEIDFTSEDELIRIYDQLTER